MKLHRLLIATALAASVFLGTAEAGQVVWLDFSNFNVNAFATINGNPPTASDATAIRRRVITNMVADYAPFDIFFTPFQPPNGRYTRVKFLATDEGWLGCAGAGCCPTGGTCTGVGSWDDMKVSVAEVYAGSLAGDSEFTGANATTARIANGLGETGSHELGHILGLSHCRSADDSFTLGCSNIVTNSQDDNKGWHIMAGNSSWGWSMQKHATRNFFFSIHSSRRVLYENFQARNHWDPLGNLNLGAGRSDLLYGRADSFFTVRWYGRLSSGVSFQPYTTWSSNAGDAGDIFLTGDVNGDNREDLVYGRILDSNTVKWYVRLSTGTGFLAASVWSTGGDPGDIFRLADVTGDNRDDLIYGRALSSTIVRWYVRPSTGSSFGNYSTWSWDAGNEGDIFLIGDVDKDGDADLVYGRALSATQMKWYVRRSSGTAFGGYETWRNDAGQFGDLFYLADVGGDGDADLVYGRILSNWQVRWYVRGSTGSGFGPANVWSNSAGDAGDLFRLGDGNGGGRNDLFYGRPRMTSLTNPPNLNIIRWYGRMSTGSSFATNALTWSYDAGSEGDFFM